MGTSFGIFKHRFTPMRMAIIKIVIIIIIILIIGENMKKCNPGELQQGMIMADLLQQWVWWLLKTRDRRPM